jgi:hypothetical protein
MLQRIGWWKVESTKTVLPVRGTCSTTRGSTPRPVEPDGAEDQSRHVVFSFEQFVDGHRAVAVFMVMSFTELEP